METTCDFFQFVLENQNWGTIRTVQTTTYFSKKKQTDWVLIYVVFMIFQDVVHITRALVTVMNVKLYSICV